MFSQNYVRIREDKDTCNKKKGLSASVEGLFFVVAGSRRGKNDRFRLDASVGRLVGNLHSMAMNRQKPVF